MDISDLFRCLRRTFLVPLALLIPGLLALPACQSLGDRAAAIALQGKLQPEALRATEFVHQAFHSKPDRSAPLLVFFDGDGSPWIRGGTRIADDPTPRTPLALQLAARTPGPVLYLGRPCYFSSVRSANCTPDVWTAARYSPRVVESMTVALERFVTREGFASVVLIGYSGGGTLALLVAPHVHAVRAVVTISANLDTDAWTTLHGYLPLDLSSNPARSAPLSSTLSVWHIIGAKDRNVPPDLNRQYWAHVPADRLWNYPDADHACCWVAKWPAIFARLQAALANESIAVSNLQR